MFKSGDIGFVMNKAVISKIIAKFMGSRWSHSFMVVGKINGVTMIIETTDFEVIISPIDEYLDGRDLVVFRNKKVKSKQIAKQSFKLVKTRYGYLQLLSLGLRRLLMKVGIKIKNVVRSGLVCCAVPLYAYQKSDTDLAAIDPESIDTEELYQVILNSRQWKQIK